MGRRAHRARCGSPTTRGRCRTVQPAFGGPACAGQAGQGPARSARRLPGVRGAGGGASAARTQSPSSGCRMPGQARRLNDQACKARRGGGAFVEDLAAAIRGRLRQKSPPRGAPLPRRAAPRLVFPHAACKSAGIVPISPAGEGIPDRKPRLAQEGALVWDAAGRLAVRLRRPGGPHLRLAGQAFAGCRGRGRDRGDLAQHLRLAGQAFARLCLVHGCEQRAQYSHGQIGRLVV